MTAVTRSPSAGSYTLGIVLRRAEAGHDHQMRIRVTMCREVVDDELELVDEDLTQDQVLGPHVLLVVRQKIPQPEMLGDRRFGVVLGHANKAVRIDVSG